MEQGEPALPRRAGQPRNHGGPDKAIHAYPAAGYLLWKADIPDLADRFRPGAFGENLVFEGVSEANVCLGDRWRIGTTLMALSQGRQSCWKLNVRFEHGAMARRVQDAGRSGWYFRVLEPGTILAGQTARLADRAHPEWPLTRVPNPLYHAPLDVDALRGACRLV